MNTTRPRCDAVTSMKTAYLSYVYTFDCACLRFRASASTRECTRARFHFLSNANDRRHYAARYVKWSIFTKLFARQNRQIMLHKRTFSVSNWFTKANGNDSTANGSAAFVKWLNPLNCAGLSANVALKMLLNAWKESMCLYIAIVIHIRITYVLASQLFIMDVI